jgi:hypothetical protein
MRKGHDSITSPGQNPENLVVPSSRAESSQRKNPNPPRVLLEGGPWRGRRTRIVSPDYCYTSRHQCMYRVAHSVLKHRLGATSVATFITKRAALVCSRRSVRSFCGRRLWRRPSAAEIARLGWVLGGCVRCWWIWTSQNSPSSSTLAIWLHGEPHRSSVPSMPVGLFAGRCPQATRKKSPFILRVLPAHKEGWAVPEGCRHGGSG